LCVPPSIWCADVAAPRKKSETARHALERLRGGDVRGGKRDRLPAG
jgi:hypothetical protein